MNDPNTKTKVQIVEKIKSSTNILVTVGRDPTVDDLSAAVGLTAMLNSMGKHATAIFSGAIPPAISFLEPDKVFEGTADSLRDFIIALDKEKADHLRYKIEGDVVKIFITPYRTTITGEDLQFSQGDFNVEIVLALGVANKDYLDSAISAHGQIIQDVTIATISAGEQTSNLGSIDWHDDTASSLSEMIVSLSDSLKTDKPLLDKQISTALLTGIVFATDRFSNVRTSAKVMTMAAQLMAAGADQQLIAAKLNDEHVINSSTMTPSIKNMAETDGAIDMPIEVDKAVEQPVSAEPESKAGTLSISHDAEEETPPTSTLPPLPESTKITPLTDSSNVIQAAEAEEPLLGGTLNATTDQAAEENRREQDDQKNKTILSHSYLAGSEPNVAASINSIAQPNAEGNNIDIFAAPPPENEAGSSDSKEILPQPVSPASVNSAPSTLPPVPTEQTTSTLPPTDSRDVDEARMAAESTFSAQLKSQPAASPVADLPLPPPLPDFSTLPPQPTPFDYSAASLATTPSAISNQPVNDDPAQFKIPG